MRRPALAERYNLNPDPGLSEVLHGEVPTTAALQPVYPLPGDVSSNGNPIGGPRGHGGRAPAARSLGAHAVGRHGPDAGDPQPEP